MATVTLKRKALRLGRASAQPNDWDDFVTALNKLTTLCNELKADFNAHAHGGAGTDTTTSAADADSFAQKA